MSEIDWVDAFAGSTVADEAWYRAQVNGNGVTHDEEDSWTPRNLADLEDKPPIQPTLGGLSLCYPGKRHVFSGPQESAKTLAAYVIGLSVVRAGSSVVLIDFEMGPWDAKTRLRELGASDDEMAEFAYVAPETKATEERIAKLVAREPALVLVDAAAGAYDLQELDDNKRADVERFTRFYVTAFWRAGIATIVLDHVTKNAETRGNYAIGSERKVGGADVHLGFSVITPIRRGTHGRYQIITHKDRGGCLKRGKLAMFELDSDPDTHHFEWSFLPAQESDEEHPFRPTGLMEKVSRWLEGQSAPQSQRAVEREKFGKTEYVREALRILITEAYVDRTEGKRGFLHESIRVYREDDDPVQSTASPTASHRVPEWGETTASRVPPPIGGDALDAHAFDADALTLEEDDGIPF